MNQPIPIRMLNEIQYCERLFTLCMSKSYLMRMQIQLKEVHSMSGQKEAKDQVKWDQRNYGGGAKKS